MSCEVCKNSHFLCENCRKEREGRSEKKDTKIVSNKGGERNRLGERWDLIPGVFDSLSEVAKVAEYGAKKYGVGNWQRMDFDSEQNPLNHAIRHAAKASSLPLGGSERTWQLAKAAWNILAQIWYEKKLTPGFEEKNKSG